MCGGVEVVGGGGKKARARGGAYFIVRGRVVGTTGAGAAIATEGDGVWTGAATALSCCNTKMGITDISIVFLDSYLLLRAPSDLLQP